MSMAVDQRPQPMGYDFKTGYGSQMHFTDPFNSQRVASSAAGAYHPQAAPMAQQPLSRHPSVSMPYAANPAASNLGSSMLPVSFGDDWTLSADHIDPDLVPSRSYEAQYTTAPAAQSTYVAHGAARYSPEQHQSVSPYNGYDADVSRRSSFAPQETRASFSDALDASRGMLAMSQSQDLTPRNIYGTSHDSRTSSQDSYGFPSTHSHHGSVSSAGSYPNYYNGSYSGSVDGSSVTDYSSASDDPMGQRTLPAPTQLISGYPPPEPASMMTQFNSKMSPNQQKKHKCKICDKRFTRPSSLQTHMYSHTGEKPFACDHEGCGRHFSVVSNLRRHKKVHKEDGAPDVGDDEE